jgi:nucleotidyltransferase substrate binding protein (TIGR01987 family)
MKNKLWNLIDQLKNALERFEEVMRQEKNDFIRDSAIQRFEFTFELMWKTLKAYLEDKGVNDLYSPRDVIRTAFRAGIIENDLKWLEMIKTRNMTSHIYNEAMAEDVYASLSCYPPLIKELFGKIS